MRTLREGKLRQRAGAAPRHPQTQEAGARPCYAGRRPQALSDPIDRKPHLLRPLAAQLLPPPLASIDPAKRLGIDLPPLRKDADFLQVLTSVLTVIARGEITPAQAHRSLSGSMPGYARAGALHG